MFVYLLSEVLCVCVWFFFVCYLPAPLQTQRPPECPARVDLPSAVLGFSRGSCTPRGRACPRGARQGMGVGPQPDGVPGAPDRSVGSPAGSRPPGSHAEQFFSTLLLRLIRAHHHPERPLPYPPRSQPRSSSRASSWNVSLPARSAGQHAPLPAEQVPHTYDHRVYPTEDRNTSSVIGFPWVLWSKPWLKFTVCKSEDTVLLSLAHVRSAAPSFFNCR